MRIFNGDIIAAGYSSPQGNVPKTRGIARWDGTQWYPLGSGITSGTIHAMAVYNGSLYVGGNTTLIDSMSIRDIARWDGSIWHTVCTLSLGLSELYALEVYNNELYIGGYFVTVNGVPISNIAKFDGTSWSAVGGGLNGDGRDFYTDTINNRLYAVGSFNSANGGSVPCPSNVAFWDGNNWNAVGPNGPSLVPSVVYVHKNEIYIGNNIGFRFNSNGDTLAGVAKWDGNEWTSLGRGAYAQDTLSAAIYALLSYNNDLAVGGGFTTVGDTSANLIAAWGDTITSVQQNSISEKLFELFPNPTSDKLEIKLLTKVPDKVHVMVNDATGKIILQQEYPDHRTNIQLKLPQKMKNGVYTCNVILGNNQHAESFVVQR